jgi:hypothetical protein
MEPENTTSSRTLFLEKFVSEIILSFYQEEIRKKKIAVAKLKQKFMLEQEPEKYDVSKFEESITNKPLSNAPPRKPVIRRAMIPKKDIRQLRRPIFRPNAPEKHPFPRPQQKPRKPPSQAKIKELTGVAPVASPLPPGFTLGKIQQLLMDRHVESIECQGPGKNLLVRKKGKTNVTKYALSKEEISEVIDHFSNQARIPVVGGILKAAVGNIIISAVVSEYVGSRFIINKINPFAPITAAY